jgi:hypothetical protein
MPSTSRLARAVRHHRLPLNARAGLLRVELARRIRPRAAYALPLGAGTVFLSHDDFEIDWASLAFVALDEAYAGDDRGGETELRVMGASWGTPSSHRIPSPGTRSASRGSASGGGPRHVGDTSLGGLRRDELALHEPAGFCPPGELAPGVAPPHLHPHVRRQTCDIPCSVTSS